ncbi:MAG: hypothetical protein PWQ91_387 [Eubacteriales bacterium]|nr:hypothetical protein [Eubacteriales bacterium]MDN5363326.1 hypothetical protein [Eubacteriales bacterium]
MPRVHNSRAKIAAGSYQGSAAVGQRLNRGFKVYPASSCSAGAQIAVGAVRVRHGLPVMSGSGGIGSGRATITAGVEIFFSFLFSLGKAEGRVSCSRKVARGSVEICSGLTKVVGGFVWVCRGQKDRGRLNRDRRQPAVGCYGLFSFMLAKNLTREGL